MWGITAQNTISSRHRMVSHCHTTKHIFLWHVTLSHSVILTQYITPSHSMPRSRCHTSQQVTLRMSHCHIPRLEGWASNPHLLPFGARAAWATLGSRVSSAALWKRGVGGTRTHPEGSLLGSERGQGARPRLRVRVLGMHLDQRRAHGRWGEALTGSPRGPLGPGPPLAPFTPGLPGAPLLPG